MTSSSGSRAEVAEVKTGLKDRIEDWCRMLLPDGRRQGRLFVANNPVTGDAPKTPELKVALTGDVGAWKCWRSGDKGDVLRLAEYVKGCTFVEALDLAKDFLGLKRMSAEERRGFAERAAKSRVEADAAAIRRRDFVIRTANDWWLSGAPLDSGTPAEAWARRYFREQRGYDLDEFANLDRSTMRFSPAFEYWTLAEWRHETGRDGRVRRVKVKAGPKLPAILSAMRTPLGQVRAVHCIFLDPREPVKASLPKPRLMFGEAGGAAIWITHGPEGVPPPEAREAHPLILSEGRETGDALGLAIPEARVWACGSINGIGACPVAWPFVSGVFVAGENDWNKPQALKQLDAALAALEAGGKPIDLMRPHAGSDFNDLLKGHE